MPRTSRVKSRTGIYHVILRGINKQVIFEEDEDHIKFLEIIDKCKSACECRVYAHCLMGNHVHLLIQEGKEPLSHIMRKIGTSYVGWYNQKYQRCGHLFQDRYKSEVIESERYFLTVLRYIHQNPLKAGIINVCGRYKWSSYHEYMGNTEYSKLTDVDYALSIFDSNREKALMHFKDFHAEEKDDACMEIVNNKKITDRQGIEFIKQRFNLSNAMQMQNLERHIKNKYLGLLKKEGLSSRQITRLTGVSRYSVLKA